MAITIESRARNVSLDMVPRPLDQLYRYWLLKRGDSRMPARSDLDPLDLPALMGWMSVVRIQANRPHFVFRLVGTKLGYRAGGPKDGQPLDEVQPVEHRLSLERQYRWVAETGAPALFENTVTVDGKRLVYHRLTLPLGSDREAPDMLLLGFDVAVAALSQFFEP